MTDRLPQVLERATALAEALADGPKAFGELTAALDGLAAPTLTRLLRALAHAGLIIKEDRAYRLGPRLEAMARRVAGSLGVEALLAPVLATLAQETADSAAFYGWRGRRVLLLAKVEVPESFHYMAVGGEVPELTRHGFAQVMVASMSEAQGSACWRRCPERERCPLPAFLARCASIRRQGYLIERGEHQPGVTRIAVAVRLGEGGALVGSLGISTLAREAAALQRRLAPVLRAGAAATRLLANAPAQPGEPS